ncbi:hypothetical protein M5J20_09840 [Corynebacterium sp. TA-R-1]|uniref:DUF2267 domain-containing protein n=1 Tax=Corynebacterium stercoris TaxID=2943490 RepID=A0ABT1G377_9CORY|nr:hypothetical protein [Corynebacterium stercoris]MCP1388480.1 hypothetical protein [Corynebacterium stercoris]
MTDTNANVKNLLNAGTRESVVADLTALVEKTIENQSGLTGMTIKAAIGTAKKADADAVSKAINMGMPQIVDELQPFWDGYQGVDTDNVAAPNTFGGYLSSREDDVVNALLDAGDKAVNQAPGAIQKMYSTMRGKAGKIVGPVLPELGEIVEKYAR